MDLSTFLPIAILSTFPANLPPKVGAELRFLQCVALVESGGDVKAVGDGGRARGAFQLHRAAWIESAEWLRKSGKRAWAWGDWQNVDAQRETAQAYFKILAGRLERAGAKVDPVNLYLAYTMGFQGFKDCDFDRSKVPGAKLNSAERVEALFLHAR